MACGRGGDAGRLVRPFQLDGDLVAQLPAADEIEGRFKRSLGRRDRGTARLDEFLEPLQFGPAGAGGVQRRAQLDVRGPVLQRAEERGDSPEVLRAVGGETELLAQRLDRQAALIVGGDEGHPGIGEGHLGAGFLERGGRAGIETVGGVLQLRLEERHVLFLHLDLLASEEHAEECHAHVEDRILDDGLQVQQRGLATEARTGDTRADRAAGVEALGRGHAQVPEAVARRKTLAEDVGIALHRARGPHRGNAPGADLEHDPVLLANAFAGLADREVVLDREANRGLKVELVGYRRLQRLGAVQQAAGGGHE